jgi:hypothetical protein
MFASDGAVAATGSATAAAGSAATPKDLAIKEIIKVKAKIAPGITKINCHKLEPLYSLLISVHFYT